MTARSIPVAGEAYLGDDPAVMKVLKVTFGDTNQDVTINDGDSTVALGRPLCSLPYGIHVYDIGWRVITEFKAGTDITLGHDCTSDCDAFAAESDIACSTLKAEMVTMRGLAIVAAADSDATTVLRTNSMGFTPDSAGNNLVAHAWQGNVSTTDSGILEVYVYYHGAPSS